QTIPTMSMSSPAATPRTAATIPAPRPGPTYAYACKGTMRTASAHVTRTLIFIDPPTSRTARPASLSSNRAATNSPPSLDPQLRHPQHLGDRDFGMAYVVQDAVAANEVERGVGERHSRGIPVEEVYATLLRDFAQRSHGLDAGDRCARMALHQVLRDLPGAGADLEDGTRAQHLDRRIEERQCQRFGCMHPVVFALLLGVVRALQLVFVQVRP